MMQRSIYILSACMLTLLSPPLSGIHAASRAAADTSSEILVVGSEGSKVFLMQKRLEDLGFYTFRATGVYGAITRNAVVAFQKANDILVDGRVGEETYNLMFGNSAKRPSASSALSQEQGPKTQPSDAKRITGQPVSWEQVHEQMRIGQAYTVTDYYTQTTFTVTRTGGNGHADVECNTNDDFAKFRSIFGGSVSWEKRPVVVSIGGTRVAASIFGMPHGYATVPTNGMSGHACIYFTGSTLGEKNLTDVEHAVMIKIATGT
ncbi:MAG: peptidoglycan-binding domain-containing protein [Bacillota bacterium]